MKHAQIKHRITVLCSGTHGNPEIRFTKMLIWALLFARTITPVVCEQTSKIKY